MTTEEKKLYNAFEEIEKQEIESFLELEAKEPAPQNDLQYLREKQDVLDRLNKTAPDPSAGVHSAQKFTKKSLRIALLVAALILLFSISAFGIQQAYEFYHVDRNITDSDVFFKPDPYTKSDLFGRYAYIPEGFRKVKSERSLWYHTEDIQYKNSNGDRIFCDSGMITEGGIHSFDTEHGDLIDITINGSPGKAIYFDYGNNVTASAVLWITGNTYHEITADNLSIAQTIKIAESRK